MIKNRNLFLAFFSGLFLAFGVFGTSLYRPQPASAHRFEPGCWVSAPATGSTVIIWLSRSCEGIKTIYPAFEPQGGKCYISWGTQYGPTKPVETTCYDANGPEATSTPLLPRDDKPGNLPIITYDTTVANCFESASVGGFRKINCPADVPLAPGCFVLSGGVGAGTVQANARETECSNITGATSSQPALAVSNKKVKLPEADKYKCGSDDQGQTFTSIDIGCRGEGNAIIDMILAISRFLSVGAGIVCVASIIVGGIQFTTSGGNPKATADAIKRIVSSVGAMVFFMFIYAILNWIIPRGLL